MILFGFVELVLFIFLFLFGFDLILLVHPGDKLFSVVLLVC